jgi:hypothetical protein
MFSVVTIDILQNFTGVRYLFEISCPVFYFKQKMCRCSNYEITKHHARQSEEDM